MFRIWEFTHDPSLSLFMTLVWEESAVYGLFSVLDN